jgi:hypothetical protein
LQAVTLKKYLSGTLSSKIEDKEHTLASLGDSPKLSVKSSPSDRGMISHDEPSLRPFLPSRSVFLISRNAIVSFTDLPEGFEDCSEVFALCRAKSSVNIFPNCDLRVSPIGRTPHFSNNPDRFKEQAGLLTSKPFSIPGNGQVLARRPKSDNIDRLYLPAVHLGNISKMFHLRKPRLSDSHRKRLNLTRPCWYDTNRRSGEWTSPAAVKQTS